MPFRQREAVASGAPSAARETLPCHGAHVTSFSKAKVKMATVTLDLLVFGRDVAHIRVAGAVHGGPRFTFLVRH
jgi:hypothetical protein